MGGTVHDDVDESKINKNKEQIRRPGDKFVFVDEGVQPPHSPWAQHPTHRTWWDQPTNRHGNGTNFSFADGHSEYYKWRNKATIDLAERTNVNSGWVNLSAEDSAEDYDWLVRGLFGRLYY